MSAGYRAAIGEAVRRGINVFDTAINYRSQASERDLGAALREAMDEGIAQRDELMICTKAGFLTPGALPEGGQPAGGVVGGIHSMAPEHLADQLERSRANLGLATIDVFYLHNPETQLRFVDAEEFAARLEAAFARCEEMCASGLIAFYGVATWSGLRLPEGKPERLSLPSMIETAKRIGGENHHFRFVQLPLNLAMPEAFRLPHSKMAGESVNVLEAAARGGITVVTSAPLLQGRLSAGLPSELRGKWTQANSDAVFALEFARSTPGVTITLAGMSQPGHVRENLQLAESTPMPVETYLKLIERAG